MKQVKSWDLLCREKIFIGILRLIELLRACLQVQTQAFNRYSEPDTRDWRGRSEKIATPQTEEKSWDSLRDRDTSFGSNQKSQSDQFSQRAQGPINQVRFLLNVPFYLIFTFLSESFSFKRYNCYTFYIYNRQLVRSSKLTCHGQ